MVGYLKEELASGHKEREGRAKESFKQLIGRNGLEEREVRLFPLLGIPFPLSSGSREAY